MVCVFVRDHRVRVDNDPPAMVAQFGQLDTLHLRSTPPQRPGRFYEDNHLEGDVDKVMAW